MIRAETAATLLKAAGEVIRDGLLVTMTLKGLPIRYKTCNDCYAKGNSNDILRV